MVKKGLPEKTLLSPRRQTGREPVMTLEKGHWGRRTSNVKDVWSVPRTARRAAGQEREGLMVGGVSKSVGPSTEEGGAEPP